MRRRFTLVELMVSISLAAILIGITAFTFIQTSKIYTETRTRVETVSGIQSALSRLDLDVRDLEISNSSVAITQGTIGTPPVRADELTFVARGSGSSFDGTPYRARSYTVTYKVEPPRANVPELPVLIRDFEIHEKGGYKPDSALKAFSPETLDRDKQVAEILSFKVSYRLKPDDEWRGEETPISGSVLFQDSDKTSTMTKADGGRSVTLTKPSGDQWKALSTHDLIFVEGTTAALPFPEYSVRITSTSTSPATFTCDDPRLIGALDRKSITAGSVKLRVQAPPYMIKVAVTTQVRAKGGSKPVTLSRIYRLRR